MTGNDASPAHIPTPATELPGFASNDSSVMDVGVKGRSSQDVSKDVEATVDDWDTDPRNPLKWSSTKKWIMIVIVTLYTFVSPLASAIMSPALPDIAVKYNISSATVVAMTLSIFLLSFAFGPLFLAPLSEIYGRTWVLHIGNLLFLAFNLACAFAPNTGTLIGMRLIAGFWGSSGLACGGGVISDLFVPKLRALPMAVFSLGPLLGPAIGPVIGGFMTETVGFKYVFVVVAACCGVVGVIGIVGWRETYGPVVRRRICNEVPQGGKWNYVWSNMCRPFVLLARSSICFMLNMYMAFMFGIYYLMFTTFPELFTVEYGFSAGLTGLCYIGLGLGCVVATIYGGSFANKIYLKLCDANSGTSKPEYRVPAVIIGSLFVPIGLFWYGWSAEAHIHWIMPIIGSAIFAFGMMTTFQAIFLYLVDAFTFAASALAAASVSRCVLGFAFPLFGVQMFDRLGYGGGNSLLAGLAIVLGIPFPVFLWFYGERIRKSSKYTKH
ncbi:major facilitator superfamily domain-containing protein [Earliella scabrosa]|nr:major facilitator superfamily domain-containing protein [Earliella scabrosa]